MHCRKIFIKVLSTKFKVNSTSLLRILIFPFLPRSLKRRILFYRKRKLIRREFNLCLCPISHLSNCHSKKTITSFISQFKSILYIIMSIDSSNDINIIRDFNKICCIYFPSRNKLSVSG